MHLVELIAQKDTDPALLDALETFVVTTLGKGVVRAKDTPNFVANRVGVFSVLATMAHTERLRPRLRRRRRADRAGDRPRRRARPTAPATSSASTPWRTSSRPCTTRCPTTRGTCSTGRRRCWRRWSPRARWARRRKAGFFRKAGKEIQVLDPAAQRLPRRRPARSTPRSPRSSRIKHPGEKLAKLRALAHPQAQFLWAIFRDLFHYCAVHLAGDRRQRARRRLRHALGLRLVDGAVRDLAGGRLEGRRRLGRRGHRRRQDAGQRAAARVGERGPGRGRRAHAGRRVQRGREQRFHPRSTLPVYARQHFPDPVLGETLAATGTTIFETDAVRMWHLGDDIAHRVVQEQAAHDRRRRPRRRAARRSTRPSATARRWCIWQTKEPFSLGANLSAVDAGGARPGSWDDGRRRGRQVPADGAAR